MIWIVIIYLGLSLLFYCILGGADFGAGALECFIPRKHRKRHEEMVSKAMGPVWEANHIWLIILIVILFNGFPSVYTQCSIYFHIPLLLMLIGIVFRGCAFTFRNYDAVKDESHRYYTAAFSISSLLTPLMFGMILAGMFFGIDPDATDYYHKYISSWFNFPCFIVGVFVVTVFTYLASVYLIGEAGDKASRDYYFRCTQKTSLIMLATGALVFVFAEQSPHYLLPLFFSNPLSLFCFVSASFLTLIFWQNMRLRLLTGWSIRLVAGAQVALVLGAWFAITYPTVLFYKNGDMLSLLRSAAPEAVIDILAWSLMIGSLLFLPILFYLIRVFKITK
jgi:cytochrome d ubiquinol oxidase subunit II